MTRRLGLALLSTLLGLGAHAETPDLKARGEAEAILHEIVGVCETRGFEACEPNFRGVDPLFAYVHAMHDLQQAEDQFVKFVRTRYAMPDFTMDKMAAHLNLKMNVTFNRSTFDDKIANVTRVPSGYDVQVRDGLWQVRRENGKWIAQAPSNMAANMQSIQRYAVAARLKRSMMVYRVLEAQMRSYDLDAFAKRFVSDLGPLTVAILRRDDLIAQMPDWERRVDEVVKFYSRFKTEDDMRAAIARSRGAN
jgi:hypothetical protein